MSEILQANIFFFIASVAVVVFVLLVSIALYHVIKIVVAVRRIVERVEQGSENIAHDVSKLRAYIIGGSLVSHVMSFFKGKARKAPSKRKSKDITND